MPKKKQTKDKGFQACINFLNNLGVEEVTATRQVVIESKNNIDADESGVHETGGLFFVKYKSPAMTTVVELDAYVSFVDGNSRVLIDVDDKRVTCIENYDISGLLKIARVAKDYGIRFTPCISMILNEAKSDKVCKKCDRDSCYKYGDLDACGRWTGEDGKWHKYLKEIGVPINEISVGFK